MKKYALFLRGLLSFLIVFSVFVPYSMYAQDDSYVASKFSIKFHRPNCKQALKIQRRNTVIFQTGKQALDAGYQPCPLCKPPTHDVNKETQEIMDMALDYYINRY
jgi:methylphosphotriester-DNA--protein-cysteine methyltransferase